MAADLPRSGRECGGDRVNARRGVSFVGRTLLSQAVSIDHDWSLSASSDDILIAALGDLSSDDLEAASLLAYHLREAIGCLLIRRQMESSAPSETHAGYPGSGLARCGAPIGAHTVAPGEEFTCRKCQTPGATR